MYAWLFLLAIAFLVSPLGVGRALGQSSSYIPIEDVPGFEGETGTDFLTYLNNLFVALVWIGGISAMFMIMLGGFWYVTSAGNTARIAKAKDIMGDAIVGLILVIGSWLILYTIDPNLTKLHFQSIDWTKNTSSSPSSNSATPAVPSDGSVPQDIKTAAQEILANCSVSGTADSCGGTALKDLQDVAAGNPMTPSCAKNHSGLAAKVTPPLPLMQMLSHLCKTNGKSVTINFFAGGEHTSLKSKHYQGRAVDIGISGRNFSDLLAKVRASASAVGMPVAGIFCDDGKGKASCDAAHHVHAQI